MAVKAEIDRQKLHRLFVEGRPLAEIANVLGSTHGTIRSVVYQERLRNPLDWPRRVNYPDKPEGPPLMMRIYECSDCSTVFALEDYEAEEPISCPACLGETFAAKGLGRFVPTSTQ